MSRKYSRFIHDDDFFECRKKFVQTKHIEEVYTPFPVHGLDKAMGLSRTRIAITAFMYGV